MMEVIAYNFFILAAIVKDILAEICSFESHSLDEIRKGTGHYKYCAFGCCKTSSPDDPCCPIIGPVSGIILAAVALLGVSFLCYCFCRRRRLSSDQLVIESNRKSSTYSTVVRDDHVSHIHPEKHKVSQQ